VVVQSQLACESGFRVAWNGRTRADDDDQVDQVVPMEGLSFPFGKGHSAQKGGRRWVRTCERKNKCGEWGTFSNCSGRQVWRNVTSTATRDCVEIKKEGRKEGG
jgi:hypothetical protein